MKTIKSLLPLLAAVSIFSGVSASTAQTLEKQDSEVVYQHRKLGFSIKYPATLTLQEHLDGVSVIDTNKSFYDGVHISIINTSLETESEAYYWIRRNFWRLRKAKAGGVFKDGEFGHSYKKIESLSVNDYPAIKILYETRQANKIQNSTGGCKPPPPIYAVSIYFLKGKDIWEIQNLASDKAQQEKNTPLFNQILSRLKFKK